MVKNKESELCRSAQRAGEVRCKTDATAITVIVKTKVG